MGISRRRWLVAGVTLVAGTGVGVLAQGSERVVKVSARKFAFTPTEITLKKGEPVTLELSTDDVFMGFSAPDLKVRSDIIPGRVMRLRFTPDRAGTFPFLCDVFCGDGHETMSGRITVV